MRGAGPGFRLPPLLSFPPQPWPILRECKTLIVIFTPAGKVNLCCALTRYQLNSSHPCQSPLKLISAYISLFFYSSSLTLSHS